MITRRQVACEDARREIEDAWAKFQVMEKRLDGHGVSGRMVELAFSSLHAAHALLAEQLKCEYERPETDDERRADDT
jgi:hypothetical protein